MATKTAWRCSQCGAVNQPGARACRECGKWPSLFDLQDSAAEEVTPGKPVATFERRPEAEPEVFDTEVFDSGSFEPEAFEPEVGEAYEAEERQSRFPRWAVTALWVLGILIWIVANALGDRG